METIERWTTRSDAWTPEDDSKLAEITLRHIREGSTQLNAFVETANVLGRTPAACGYRWNGVVRRHFENEIKRAKLEKKEKLQGKSHFPRRRLWAAELEDPSIDGVVRALKQHERSYFELQERNRSLEQQVFELQHLLHELTLDNERLRSQQNAGSTGLGEDPRSLLAIMERARQLIELENNSEQTHEAAN
ncbi:MAG: RsfA family transcriptional regulator [Bacilli bacterium]|nr:RsfA family transcriptional regulator [Bacilli bacterium]